jgi:hypothetical protein
VPLALPPWLTAVLLLLMVLVGPVRAGENLRVPLECRLGQGSARTGSW